MYDPFIYRNVTHPPKEITNKLGKIILVKNGLLDLSQSETIRWVFVNIQYFAANPLADGFDILLGSYTVKVPNVTPGPYQILGKRYGLPVSLRMSINLWGFFLNKKKQCSGILVTKARYSE